MSTQKFSGSSYKAIDSSISQKKCLACNAEKLLQLKITKMNITKFINIYIQTYIPKLYVTKMTQNENDSINSCY